nr:hypothetical protein NG677_13270 [Methylobacterium sp. OTU13CASTA1]
MLTFATEFPINHKSTGRDFISAIKQWILGSPHTKFVEEDFIRASEDDEFTISRGNQSFRSIHVCMDGEEFAAINHVTTDNNIDWNLEAVFNHSGFDAWIAIRVSRESESPVKALPSAKKPVLVRVLLEALGGGNDGDLAVKAQPHFLLNDQIEIPSNIILGQQSNRLPIVYVSCGFRGKHDINVESFASDISGMAHILVEPNRAFSYRLQLATSSRNAFGGTIGIYWPDATGRKSFFNIRDYSDKRSLKESIITTLRHSLLNRRPLHNCTWSAVQELFSKHTLTKLRAAGSQNVDEYISAFDRDIKAKDQQIASADKEIERLKLEIKKYESLPYNSGAIQLNVSNEQQFTESEFNDLIIDILSESSKNSDIDSRKSHLIVDIINSNSKNGKNQTKKDRIKSLLGGYTKMNAGIRRELDDLGFTVTDDGKHYKATYQDDPRYTFSVSKSGSDNRSGLNLASDITKKIF